MSCDQELHLSAIIVKLVQHILHMTCQKIVLDVHEFGLQIISEAEISCFFFK